MSRARTPRAWRASSQRVDRGHRARQVVALMLAREPRANPGHHARADAHGDAIRPFVRIGGEISIDEFRRRTEPPRARRDHPPRVAIAYPDHERHAALDDAGFLARDLRSGRAEYLGVVERD